MNNDSLSIGKLNLGQEGPVFLGDPVNENQPTGLFSFRLKIRISGLP